MSKRPWDKPEPDNDPSSLVAYEEFRRYQALSRRYHQQMRREQRRTQFLRIGLPTLAGLVSCAAVWAFLAYNPSLSFGSSSSFRLVL